MERLGAFLTVSFDRSLNTLSFFRRSVSQKGVLADTGNVLVPELLNLQLKMCHSFRLKLQLWSYLAKESSFYVAYGSLQVVFAAV